jgi:hypothetical protein
MLAAPPLAGVLTGDRAVGTLAVGFTGELIRDLPASAPPDAKDAGGGMTPDLFGRFALFGLIAVREGVLDEAALVRDTGKTGESIGVASLSSIA